MKPTLKKMAQLTLSLALAGIIVLLTGHRIKADEPVSLPLSDVNMAAVNGHFTLELFLDGQWQVIAQPGFNEFPAERQLSLPTLPSARPILVRLTHPGHTAAHLDTILLNGQPPLSISGQAESQALALRKLTAANNDLIDVAERTLLFEFPLTPNPQPLSLASLTLIARIEPPRITSTPFQYPLSNLYKTLSPQAEFYTYRWDSNPGQFTPDGELNAEKPGKPFFKAFSRTGTGHPSDYIYGWVRNDADTLYVALDFVPDNTMDGEKDYAKVYVNTPTGLKMFKASVPEQRWGRPGFTYTPQASYQHKIYEFALPLSDLGLTDLRPDTPLELAFAAYGTAAPPDEYPGILDNTFGIGGVVTTTFGSINTRINDLALQADKKIVAVGQGNNSFNLARYTTNGILDSSFGTGGVITDQFSTYDLAHGVALQAHGKIVAVGQSSKAMLIARYTDSGTLDSTFGTGGVVTTTVYTFTRANDVLLQPDGKIVVAGTIHGGNSSLPNHFLVARYSTTGTLDSTFGQSGLVTTTFSTGGKFNEALCLARQADGKIVVVGDSPLNDFIVVRYTLTGTLDSTFGSGGQVTTDFGGTEIARDVVVQDDGRILVTGYMDNDFGLARYTISGTLDSTFGSGGYVTTDFGSTERGQGVALRSDGKIVVVGYTSEYRLSVAQYNPDGSLDTDFGTSGRANNALAGSGYDHGYAVVIQPDDNKIVVAGGGDNQSTFLLARYLILDTCFVSLNNSGTTDYKSATASAVQAAVNAANPGDTLKIAGTCAGVQQTAGLTQTVYISKSLTLQGGYTHTNWLATPNPDLYPTTLSAQHSGRVMVINGTIQVQLDKLTVTEGKSDVGGNPTPYFYNVGHGGGIYNHGEATVRIMDSILFNNQATDNVYGSGKGGGLYVASGSGSTVISNTQIISNSASNEGGGLYAAQAITITNSAINRNKVSGYGGGATIASAPFALIQNSDIISNVNDDSEGGGLYLSYNAGQIRIQASRILSNVALNDYGGGIYADGGAGILIGDSEIAYNQADYGGGMYFYASAYLILDNSSIHHNAATGYTGGGIHAERTAVTATNSTLAYNTAGKGGGLYNYGSSTQFYNSTLSHNQADYGGGVYIYAVNSGSGPSSGLLTLTHVSLISNTGVISGGGLYLEDQTDSNAYIVQATMQNSLIAHNSGDNCDIKNGWELLDASLGYNLDSDGTCIAGGGTGNQTSADTKLGPLADNGGETETHALLDGSPAIDAIPDDGSCVLATDQRGISRPQGTACDIGAFETGQSFSLSISGGNNQRAEIETAFAQPLQVSLVVSGTTVGKAGQVITFTGPSSGAGINPVVVTATTNSSGVAVLTPTANSNWGDYAVIATASGVSQPVTFTLENYAFLTLTTAYTGSGIGSVTAGDVYTNGTAVTITATENSVSYFGGWVGDVISTTNPLTVSMDSHKNITATFNLLTYTLITETLGNGTINLDPAGGVYDYGMLVTLSTTPDTGWQFAGWSGDIASGSALLPTITLAMNSNKAITATFIPITHSITITTSGNGSVTLDPPGGVYDYGTIVTLTAEPDSGNFFAGWTGDVSRADNPISVTMDSDLAITATFSEIITDTPTVSYTLTTTVGGSGTISPTGGTYLSGTEISLVATPDSGWQFDAWSGDASGSLTETTVLMDADKVVTATFSEIITDTPTVSYTLTTTVVGSGTISPTGGLYLSGTEVSLVATPDSGWQFDAWSGDASGSLTETTVLMDADKVVTATFSEIITDTPTVSYTLTTTVVGSGTISPTGGLYLSGTEVSLVATPDSGWQFEAWSGDVTSSLTETTVLMDADKVVTATFSELISQPPTIYLPLVVK